MLNSVNNRGLGTIGMKIYLIKRIVNDSLKDILNVFKRYDLYCSTVLE